MFTLELVPNTDCNLNCYYCFACKKDSTRLDSTDILRSLQVAERISESQGYEELFIKIYGGESLLMWKDIYKALQSYKDCKSPRLTTHMAIITNGTIMTEEFVNNLKELNKWLPSSITISFEGSPRLHNQVRVYKNGRGSYDEFIKNIRNYLSWSGKKRVHLQTVLSPILLENIEEYIETMEEMKDVATFDLIPMFDHTFDTVDSKLLLEMDKLFKYYERKYLENDAIHVGIFQTLRSISSLFMQSQGLCSSHCSAGWGQLTVVPNKELLPCSKFYHNNIEGFSYGFLGDPIEKLCENFTNKVKLFKELTAKDMECARCQKANKFGCTGMCIAETVPQGHEKLLKVCEYTVHFGILSRKLWESIHNTEEFREYKVKEFQGMRNPTYFQSKMKSFMKGDYV